MDTLPAVSSVSEFSQKELISFLLQRAGQEEIPVAVWQLPGADETHMILSETSRKLDAEEFLEELDPGFMMAPFDKSAGRYFLPADRFFTFRNGRIQTADGPAAEKSAQWLNEHLPSAPADIKPFRTLPLQAPAPEDASRNTFLNIVREGIAQIESGAFEKIVPSRTRTIPLSANFDVVTAFQRLCSYYPQALISFVNIPGVGSWLGASPEILVCVQDKTLFKTVALAGTLPYQPGIDLRSVAWTQKEIEEQALVERYVISCFKKIRLREYEEHGPKTVVAGNLIHLKSEFTVDMKTTNFPQMGTVMLDLLHPTSAVCGMPLETSLAFLKMHEKYDRGFYAGYLGPVNVHNRIDLFVNLRCMQIADRQGILYAGAGVTADSIPEKEWEETEMKMNTLLNVIF